MQGSPDIPTRCTKIYRRCNQTTLYRKAAYYKKEKKQDPEVNDASSSHFSIFHFLQLFHFFTLFDAPSSSSLLPPHPSLLFFPPSSSSLLPPCSSYFLVQHCLNHLETIKCHFSPYLTKALPTNQRTNQRTNQPTEGQGLL